MEGGGLAFSGVLPSGDVGEFVVLTFSFTFLGGAVLDFGVFTGELAFAAEVSAAGFGAVEGVMAEDFGEFDGGFEGFFGELLRGLL